MDLKCHICGEPWGIDALHEAVAEGHVVDFDDARGAFYRDGCAGLGMAHSANEAENAAIISELQALMGDDIDGLASLMEDFGL